jgi:hypothetical protein
VALAPGDRVEVELRADLVDADYVWRWHTRVHGPRPATEPRLRLAQSSFAAEVLSPDRLRRRGEDHVPVLSEPGQGALMALALMGQGRDLGAIADALAAQFPGPFPDRKAALAFAAGLSENYSR